MHNDFKEFVVNLLNNDVKFIIVGAFALAFHGFPRNTGDIDIWIYPDEKNSQNTLKSIEEFFGSTLGVSRDDILSGKIIQFGRAPVRIDLITKLTGVDTDELWEKKIQGKFSGLDVNYIDKDTFIKNKRAIGRSKDIADADSLELD